mgnify:CR=1 FL=1
MLIGMTKIFLARVIGARLNEVGFVPSGTIRLATEEEDREARAEERQNREAVPAWCCNHCSIHLGHDRTETLRLVKEHLRDM